MADAKTPQAMGIAATRADPLRRIIPAIVKIEAKITAKTLLTFFFRDSTLRTTEAIPKRNSPASIKVTNNARSSMVQVWHQSPCLLVIVSNWAGA
jgi:hypothetical protein